MNSTSAYGRGASSHCHNGIIGDAMVKGSVDFKGHEFNSDTDYGIGTLFFQADKKNLSPEDAMKSV